MGQLYDIIQRHIDAQPYGTSVRRVADALGVSPTTVANWREPKELLKKEHLEAIARVTGTPYREVLAALLVDIGYQDDDPDVTPFPSSGSAPASQRPEVGELQKKAARKDPQ